MDLIIRPFTPEDHPPALEIHNAIWPDTPQTLEDRLEADGRRHHHCVDLPRPPPPPSLCGSRPRLRRRHPPRRRGRRREWRVTNW